MKRIMLSLVIFWASMLDAFVFGVFTGAHASDPVEEQFSAVLQNITGVPLEMDTGGWKVDGELHASKPLNIKFSSSFLIGLGHQLPLSKHHVFAEDGSPFQGSYETYKGRHPHSLILDDSDSYTVITASELNNNLGIKP